MKPAILILFLIVLMGGCSSLPPVRPVDNVFFTIGREDKSDSEFKFTVGMSEYHCTIGVDCSTEAFPAYLGLAGSGYGVERIIISFRLDQAYNNVILRLARGGDETTVVIVDRKQTYLVTNTMLGSGEGFRVGVYNLELGTLKKGVHTIEMSVADDGKGNAAYQWDALSLFVR
ncbi:MAG TPA: hypothetical protein VMX75_02165 [Spirochaetia bacterium]|nr:hypothetical protein [Spirochaetia bacterium]